MSIRTAALVPLAAAFLAVAVAALNAQSMPAMTTAKNAAHHAVAATNRQLAAEQNTGDPTPAQARPRPTAAAHIAELPHGAARAAEAKVSNKVSKADPKSPVAPHGRATAAHAVHSAKARDTVSLAGPQGEGTTSISERGGKNEIALMRESFTYNPDGRRDPFVSLITSGELRPMVSDLKLVAVIFDPAGGSVAILRNVSTKEQYRVKTGQTLGRMRVTRIDPKTVTFTLEEFGYSRQEALALNDSTRAR